MAIESFKSVYVKSYWQYYRSLEKRFLKTEEFVAFDKVNSKSYSFEYLTLLQTICSEIDVVAKAVCFHFDNTFPTKDAKIQRWGFRLQKEFPDITNQTIYFRQQKKFTPWAKWTIEQKLNKQGKTYLAYAENCGSPFWWNAYNAVKHARTTIDDGRVNYEKANLKNVLYALGALYILHRLMMRRIDDDMYNYIDKSELFKVPDSYDELNARMFYDNQGHPCIYYGNEDEETEERLSSG